MATTEDLERLLKESNEYDEQLILENGSEHISDVLCRLLTEKGIKRSKLIRALNIDRNYGYQILNGTRVPTRMQIIHIALYLQLSTEELQYLLRLGCREGLYVRNIIDARIMYALEHSYTYEQACEFIFTKES